MSWTLYFRSILSRLSVFRDDTRGSMTVEMVVTMPILIWGLVATYDFFEIHRFQSARDKATYTLADMLSREEVAINDIYLDNAKTLFDQIANDSAANQIRISAIQFDGTANEYVTQWSEVRGTGGLVPFARDEEFPDGANTLPILNNGEVIILLESNAIFEPILELVFSGEVPIETRVFTSLRFAPQLICVSCS